MMQATKLPQDPQPETVACEICLKEIPRSVARSLEGTEYVYYFCGADCYRRWQELNGKQPKSEGND